MWDTLPVHVLGQRFSPVVREILQSELQAMQGARLIYSSQSQYSSLIVFLITKDGDICFSVDFKKLNEVAKMDTYPLPQINGSFDCTLGFMSGYWQTYMREEDINKLAYPCPGGFFEFKQRVFGIKNAGATLQGQSTSS